MNVHVVSKSDPSVEQEYVDQVNRAIAIGVSDGFRVAVDGEGVNLGRKGTLEILSVCFEVDKDTVFLVDFQKTSKADLAVRKTKELLECEEVVKIIHDCRMDCDVLYQHYEITMKNVHDTQCFHKHIYFSEKLSNLNDTLAINDIPINVVRDSDVYKQNPRFWATRPVTDKMKRWASGDVNKLFQLADMQLNQISRHQLEHAKEESRSFTKLLVDMETATVECLIPIGRFIGRGGKNIRSVEKRTGCFMYQDRPLEKSTFRMNAAFIVYYPSRSSLTRVEEEMGHHKDAW